jgi:hypothetical protein
MANRYRDIARATTEEGVEYTVNPIYPEIPLSEDDFYIITSEGDRYDVLAQQFYSDYTLWWIIASANNTERGSLVTQPGVQLRIPTNKDKILQAYNQFNKKR